MAPVTCACRAWGGGNGNEGPGGVALLDHSSFEVLAPFETAGRGGQYLAYDVVAHQR